MAVLVANRTEKVGVEQGQDVSSNDNSPKDVITPRRRSVLTSFGLFLLCAFLYFCNAVKADPRKYEEQVKKGYQASIGARQINGTTVTDATEQVFKKGDQESIGAPQINGTTVTDATEQVFKKGDQESIGAPQINGTTVTDANWWHPYVDKLARPKKKVDKSWCIPRPRSGPKPRTGLYMVKTPKTGSSTSASVAMQMAVNVGKRLALEKNNGIENNNTSTSGTTCNYYVEHDDLYALRKEPYLLWTTLRNPHKRAVSAYFFFRISRGERRVSEHVMRNYLEDARSYQLMYIGFLHGRLVPGTGKEKLKEIQLLEESKVVEMIDEIMETYHFIAITERMAESLTVMKLLFELKDEDILTLSSKTAGGMDDGQHRKGCMPIVKAFTYPGIDEYIANEFRVRNHDYFLYVVANRTLDMTIDSLGRDVVEQEVKRYKKQKRLVEDHCANTTIFASLYESYNKTTSESRFENGLL